MKKVLFSAAIFVFSFFGCSDPGPAEIVSGTEKCAHCSMGIINEKYHSQIVTFKGRHIHFDSIECMYAYKIQNEDKVRKAWVHDFSRTKEWIETENAKFLKSEKLLSPMAGNLSAYSSDSDLKSDLEKFGGRQYTGKEIADFVKAEWSKTGSVLKQK
ncbi:MAG TPA: nitrous oxide reductase accessory protein NosL [Leptospiraceae bacterium]|nr:nitrous oxide reductase accessory protein NosL [Leptospiraceae bacterium]